MSHKSYSSISNVTHISRDKHTVRRKGQESGRKQSNIRTRNKMSQSINTIELDGRTFEGGGQLLRIALCLSSLTGVPIHVAHIRGKRGTISEAGIGSAGGLKAAHLAAAAWLAKATAAITTGMELRSTELAFQPTRRIYDERILDDEGVWKKVYEDGELVRRETLISMSSNGSTLLILQAILPFLLYLPSLVPLRVTIQGGTNVTSSPTIEYVSQVFLPLIATKFHITPIRVTLHRRGWCFGGNEVGKVSFDIEPIRKGAVQQALQLTSRGKVEKVHISVIASSDGTREHIKAEALEQLSKTLPGVELLWIVDEDSGSTQRTYLLMVVEMSSGVRLGRDCLSSAKASKKSQNNVQKDAKEGCRKLVSKVIRDVQREMSWEGCVDEYMEDQLVIFEALSLGRSEIDAGKGREVSLHTQTAQWVAMRLLDASFEDGRCNGIGFSVVDKPSFPENTIASGLSS